MPVSTVQMFDYPTNIFPLNQNFIQRPTTITHKVWIVDCRTCQTFLTNRAMKAVLLLRPHVSLYSSDTLPINCSVYHSHSELQPRSSSNNKDPVSHRTCECLTQTLCCHGCGNTVGYMIVAPCVRCTSSISANNRATNGHRFVFHSSEVIGTERHYVKGENGVNPIEPPQMIINTPTVPSMQSSTPGYSSQYPPSNLPPYSPRPSETPRERQSSSIARSDYLPTPPLEFASTAFLTSRYEYPGHDTAPESYLANLPSWGSRSLPPLSPAQSQFTSFSSADSRDLSSTFQTADHKDYPVQPATLKPGDNVFWHHLTRSGEIAAVADDERARFAKSTPFFNR
ncbi:FAM72 protein-domain-containing protein [Panaeolus papilionaceus]|nr:FAM72 protein-domain-containing protein [Panaeolus papilionaceus]